MRMYFIEITFAFCYLLRTKENVFFRCKRAILMTQMQEKLNRSIAPEFHKIKQIQLPPSTKKTLPNGTDIIIVNTGIQNILKLEISFKNTSSGKYPKSTAQFAFKMLTEGTKKYDSLAINEYYDQHGGFIETSQGMDKSAIVVFGLTKYLPEYAYMLKEMISNSIFPENELQIMKDISIQNLKLNSEKNSFLASKAFRKLLFKNQHPYGYAIEEEDIVSIQQKELVRFHKEYIANQPFTIYISGKISETEVAIIEKEFGFKTKESTQTEEIISIELQPEKTTNKLLIQKPKALQSSIRLGKKMVLRSHPDYHKILITNEIIGGYFGSRLMKNIREEKGLTYGISSSIVALKEAAYLVIGADVKKEFTQTTIDEIKKEINILQNKLVPEEELQTVKNYMAGAFAGSINTPFEIMDRHKVIENEHLPVDFYDQYIPKLNQITTEEIRETALKYFDITTMVEVIVGDK